MERTALVTGGNRGIGLEVCRALASRGLRVLLGARDAALGEAAAAALRAAGGVVQPEVVDVASDASVAVLAGRLAGRGERVDVLVNDAGIYPSGTLLAPEGDRVLRDALEVNLWGAVRTCRAFLPAMVRAGYGRVVNVSSGAGSFGEGLDGPPAYALSKAALNALTVKLAEEAGAADVKVNAVCPGWVRTRMGGAGAPRSVEEGAAGVVWLATLPADGPSGGFFRDRLPIPW